MADAKKKKNATFTTPIGVFRFPKLTEPDFGSEKYAKKDGEYSVQLVFRHGSEPMRKLEKTLAPFYEKALENAERAFKELGVKARKEFEKKNVKGPVPNGLYSEIYDKETEEPTGEVCFKFSMKASGQYKKGPKAGKGWTRKPVLFDAAGKRITNIKDIWGGTRGRVSFTVGEGGYFVEGTAAAGLKLYLDAVQIIELVSEGGKSAEGYGFGAEEGYTHEEQGPFQDETASEGTTQNEGDNGDF
jgi:hypothetical protein